MAVYPNDYFPITRDDIEDMKILQEYEKEVCAHCRQKECEPEKLVECASNFYRAQAEGVEFLKRMRDW